MKRTFSILLLGLICGLGAHLAWFSATTAPAPGSLTAQLSWMKTNLQLTDAQLLQIKALHEQSAPRLLALAAQVDGIQQQLAQFEQQRQNRGRVDFLEFARFVEEGRRIDQECVLSTEQLVAAATEVMNPRQRQQYLSLLGPALKTLRPDRSG
jgi:capsule polysaccharide export protein KpsE/RkpR